MPVIFQTFVLIMSLGQPARMVGPFNLSIQQCNSRLEVYVKLYLAEPRINGVPAKGTTYQCVTRSRHI